MIAKTGLRPFLARGGAFALGALLLLACLPRETRAEDFSVLRIGVLSRESSSSTRDQWAATAGYLKEKLPGRQFQIVPLSFGRVEDAVVRKEIDFLVANPQVYVEMEMRHGVSRLATMKRRAGEYALTQFGGVIFCLSSRDELHVLDDLAGKRLAAPDATSFGGWIAPLFEMKKAGINPEEFFKKIVFRGSDTAVVAAVAAGEVDAGTVRTGSLEKLAREGKISLIDFHIISPRDTPGFPLPHSTDLYPEWVFARLPHVPYELAEQAALSLMTMPQNHPAAAASGTAGWTIPSNYHTIFAVLMELKIGAYREFSRVPLADVIKGYWRPMLLAGLLIAMLAGVGIHVTAINRRLGVSQRELRAELAERKLIEQKLRGITEMLGEGVYLLDEKGNLAFMNPEAEHLLGFSESELLGKNMHDAIHHTKPDGSPFPAAECPANRTVTSGRIYRVNEDFFFRKDGTRFPVSFVATPILQDNKVAGSVSVFHDITRQKEAERELLESKNAAEEATKLKDKFISLVAHDLKTPLNNIIGYQKMLHKDADGKLEPSQKMMLEKAFTGAENLAYMIDELLDISRLQTGKIIPNKNPVDARTLASAALEKFSHPAAEKGIALVNNVPRGVFFSADFQLFSRVLQNLVSNAVKFSVRGGTVTIALSDRPPNTLVVTDTGVGVPPGILPDIFKHEEKTSTIGTAGEVGTGLGLPFSYDIMKAHGGTLWVESESGKGSSFYVSLPREPDAT